MTVFRFTWLFCIRLGYLFTVLWCSAKTCKINLMVHYVLCLLRSEAEIKYLQVIVHIPLQANTTLSSTASITWRSNMAGNPHGVTIRAN